MDNIKGKHFRIHRLILLTFQGEISGNKTDVNHIDGNKDNNKLDNLEYVSNSENIIHSYAIGLNNNSKCVLQFKLDGTFVCQFKNSVEAQNITGISRSTILRTCNGVQKIGRGFVWKFK